MIYVTSDLHGKFDHLLTLLDRAEFFQNDNNQLYILGDVIDRHNQGGIDALKWIREQPNVHLLMGNHEKMLLDARWIFDGADSPPPRTDDVQLLDLWKRNGGYPTIIALKQEPTDVQRELLDYLASRPRFATLQVGKRSYVLVHGGLGNFTPTKELWEYTDDELLWERPTPYTVYAPRKYTVILGHTPTELYDNGKKGRMLEGSGWWNIDTGAANPFGSPMLLCLDTLQEFYMDGSPKASPRRPASADGETSSDKKTDRPPVKETGPK